MTELASDKRTTPRRRVLKEGKIVFSNGNFVIDCIIDNLSETGAHLRLQGRPFVPGDFYLVEISRSVVHKAVIVRRTDKGLGIRFAGVLEDAAIRDALLRKFKR
jgi:hypothetical protein